MSRGDWEDRADAMIVEAGRRWRERLQSAPMREVATVPGIVVIHMTAEQLASRAESEEHVATLVELARAGRRQDFVDLAGCLGVGAAEMADLWEGTRRRVGKDDA